MNLFKKGSLHWDKVGNILIVLFLLIILVIVYLIFKDKMVEVIEKFKEFV
jgi:regulatory protein YycI of two-component signal transduction system YycFG